VIRQKAPAWPLEQVAVVDRKHTQALPSSKSCSIIGLPVRAAINEGG